MHIQFAQRKSWYSLFLYKKYMYPVCTIEVVAIPDFIWEIYVYFVRTTEMVVLPVLYLMFAQ